MRDRLPAFIAASFFLGTLGLVLFFGLPEARNLAPQDRLFVVTTMYPLADFIQNVGGEYVYVSNVIPPGAEPHDYEPSPQDVAEVLEADVLVYLGGGFDQWAEDMAADTTENGGLVLGVDQAVPMTVVDDVVDPHLWLDLVLAQDVVRAIQQTLTAADPDHAVQYAENANDYLQKLLTLEAEYAATLARCELDDIIASHDAFGYLARRYNFTIHAIAGLSPEAEPSVRDLTLLAREARSTDVQVIFFETLVSSELAETLAKEVGITTAVLNPIEGLTPDELAAGDDYLSVMSLNREALAAAMLCQ
jgi:zinc transport system substrate-binding protein